MARTRDPRTRRSYRMADIVGNESFRRRGWFCAAHRSSFRCLTFRYAWNAFPYVFQSEAEVRSIHRPSFRASRDLNHPRRISLEIDTLNCIEFKRTHRGSFFYNLFRVSLFILQKSFLKFYRSTTKSITEDTDARGSQRRKIIKL